MCKIESKNVSFLFQKNDCIDPCLRNSLNYTYKFLKMFLFLLY